MQVHIVKYDTEKELNAFLFGLQFVGDIDVNVKEGPTQDEDGSWYVRVEIG